MSSIADRLFDIGEPFAAGFFEDPDKSNFFRFAKATRRYREVCRLPEYNGELVYPNGKRSIDDFTVMPHFAHTFDIYEKELYEKAPELAETVILGMPRRFTPSMDEGRLVMGGLYTHANPNYERILAEGLASYKERVLKCRDKDFRAGCLEVIASIEIYLERVINYLSEVGARKELIDALRVVPMYPARNLYDALVEWNFLYYIDFCDNVGEMDRVLDKYYGGEDAVEVIRQFFRNVDANDGWSLRIGPRIYPISKQIMRASGGIRRPSVELCIDGSIPDDVWELAAELVSAGSCNPVFYNYPLYQKLLHERFPSIPREDLERFCGCGCSETMLSGISRSGSTDAAFNLIYLFSKYMREHLATAGSFEDFYNGYLDTALELIDEMYDIVNAGYKERAVTRPQPVRTLLIDDCIDRETDFNSGGARWNWALVNFAGSINVVESMLSIRELVFERGLYSPSEFIPLLDAEDEMLYRRIKKCPHYGVGDARADALAADLIGKIFSSADGKKSYFGEGFITSSIQFTTYVPKGKFVPATPDGRRAGEPICDSLAPIMGNDTKSVTTTLASIAALPLHLALGTPIVNLRLSKKYAEKMLRPLVLGFFENGGMQLQISCISREDMIEAIENPDRHRDLLVRVGGYSEYFVNLKPEAQASILKRTEYGI